MTQLRAFEDIAPGEVHEAGPIAVTREAIVAFALMYDPQPFHLDEAAGAGSLLGGLAASGWQTAALGMRLLYEAFVSRIASMGAPGLDEVRWLKPVRPGDNLRLRLTVGATRTSKSRPDRGFVGIDMALANEAGVDVMTQRFTVMVQRRDAQAAPSLTVAAQEMPAAPIIPAPALEPDLVLTTFYDDVAIGHESTFGTQVFTADLITAFATLYDPQPFHLDAEAARRTHFGALCASGWQTAAFWMKHYIAARTRSAEARAARSLEAAVGGPSPGFTDMKWLYPVRVGDAVRYGLRITGKRRAGRSGWGMISTINTGHFPDGRLAFSFNGRLLWPTAPAS